jgi:hypothetical protein
MLRRELENLCSLLFSWISRPSISNTMAFNPQWIPVSESILAIFLKLVQEKVS